MDKNTKKGQQRQQKIKVKITTTKKIKRQHDKNAKRQKYKDQKEFSIVTSGQFLTLAMFSGWLQGFCQ